MSEDRTEKPTSKRLRELRKKGQIPASTDLGQAMSFFAAVIVLGSLGAGMGGTLAAAVKSALIRVGQRPLATMDTAELGQMVIHGLTQIVIVTGPLAAASIIAVVATQVAAQRGFVFASEAIRLNWGSLNPVKGLKRMGLSQGGYALLRAVIVSAALATVGYQTVQAFVGTSPMLSRVAVSSAVSIGWGIGMGMFWKAAIILLTVGGADYGYQRFKFTRMNRMTKQEVKDEHRQIEGNPEIKGRIRRMQRSLFRRRMMAAVPRATVVVTNPTHYAMALEYRRGEMPAPRVVAKGKNLIAQRIKDIARESGVPIVENKPLAQALYKSVDIGDVIPADLFDAVAEVLAYLIRLKQLVL